MMQCFRVGRRGRNGDVLNEVCCTLSTLGLKKRTSFETV